LKFRKISKVLILYFPDLVFTSLRPHNFSRCEIKHCLWMQNKIREIK